MKSYAAFAQIYDRCMDNVPYDEWAARIREIFAEHGVPEGGIVADLGCGTGAMTVRLRDSGYDLIGIDSSEEMLMIAQEREYDRLAELEDERQASLDNDSTENDDDDECSEDDSYGRITYLCQDIRSFELYGTVAAIVSVCDSLNYILEENDLLQTFRLVNNYLDRDGVFVFDMKSPHYYRNVLGDCVRVEDYEDATLIWDNSYEEKTGTNEYRLTVFLRDGEDSKERYVRNDEEHVQKAYSLEMIKALIEESGLVFVGAYDAYTSRPATAESERFVIVAKEGFQKQKYYG